jgi:Na+/H+-translocating membrane pyrophosphatase
MIPFIFLLAIQAVGKAAMAMVEVRNSSNDLGIMGRPESEYDKFAISTMLD